ncbi:nitrilotriacetate monooxygenase [Mammaliicoccus lentus]|uniref:LLM class flavin-dependent oxidoreductase n=1 Tax=Mammaliicoccus TaxID=2803850 RepID=UPI0002E10F82|nr:MULTISPECIES: LLM class flavin-dependent oxidoreductase [Mammaliicoccus]MBF0840671.1 LLM class flavin-dependent oxidoreductase [Mammaliicoccus lentus]MBW0771032.1 LLM class flavin-dependent oxidoreductase [Mammaliicoccus lentus]MCD2477927.1 LLM class flavin-dependent oxidoreductase [Mammaliicoccus lentus]MCD2519868.1 LLM class flavin-dependent oxidoreductase [Mammaliicoccus lentus]MDQ7143650.1 LLM class flavin-dependent oxidoreductase [Mammaliicoccus lentus]
MKRMKLGYFLTGFGHHVASSRHPESVERGGMNLKKTIEQAKSLEQAKFDFLFVSDSLYVDKKTHPDMFTMFEPISLMSIIAMETKHLGLIITGSTTYSEPFNLSRIFSSLDHYSDGRAGWNIVTSGINDTAKNFSGVNNVDHDLRYDQANEFVEISKKLWNSWRDVDSQSVHKAGKFLKNQQPEPINYEGDFYSVKGPLNIDQSPQGYPLLVQAGSSKKGTDFASKHAEVIFTAQNDIDASINFAQKLRRQVEEKRGPEQEVVIMPGIFPFIGETRKEAQANYKELQDLIDPEMGLELLSSYLGDTDLSGYDLNTPFEDVEVDKGNNIQSRVDLIKETAKRNNSTLEDVMKHVAGARGHHIIVGTPEDVADRMEEWFKRGAADGFNIMPPLNPTQFELFVNKVVPILKERGLVQTDYNEGTLREKLGLSNVKTHS